MYILQDRYKTYAEYSYGLSEGKATMDDIKELEELCKSVKDGSLCGLGKTSPNPVITGLRYFRENMKNIQRVSAEPINARL